MRRTFVTNDRKVGLLFAAAFGVAAFYPAPIQWWAMTLAGAFTAVAALAPARLAPLTRIWMGIGHVLGRIVNPIVMGILFFGMITPIALVRRLRGSSPIPLAPDPDATTYWKLRTPPGPDPATLPRQY
jgi:hypothetical protein